VHTGAQWLHSLLLCLRSIILLYVRTEMSEEK
jgi:hypothetical protein